MYQWRRDHDALTNDSQVKKEKKKERETYKNEIKMGRLGEMRSNPSTVMVGHTILIHTQQTTGLGDRTGKSIIKMEWIRGLGGDGDGG